MAYISDWKMHYPLTVKDLDNWHKVFDVISMIGKTRIAVYLMVLSDGRTIVFYKDREHQIGRLIFQTKIDLLLEPYKKYYFFGDNLMSEDGNEMVNREGVYIITKEEGNPYDNY